VRIKIVKKLGHPSHQTQIFTISHQQATIADPHRTITIGKIKQAKSVADSESASSKCLILTGMADLLVTIKFVLAGARTVEGASWPSTPGRSRISQRLAWWTRA
jgi:hypothetical protein